MKENHYTEENEVEITLANNPIDSKLLLILIQKLKTKYVRVLSINKHGEVAEIPLVKEQKPVCLYLLKYVYIYLCCCVEPPPDLKQ